MTAPARFIAVLPDDISDRTGAQAMLNPLTTLELLRAVRETWAAEARPLLQTAAG